ncbi:MAG: 2-C-methyl-D-erythritol 4-phosphate cytidylyltransferase [Candidatus Dormibacteraeota bacterium]|nr:2-C-methyl-D-erythritol 4-phosphate cytidylyltransferase [Candidatus Dormibacteraeota bacterium]
MGEDKLFADVAGRPLIAHTLAAGAASAAFVRVVIAAPAHRHTLLAELAATAGFTDVVLTLGGARRQDSVRAALEEVGDAELVAVHDAARPLCAPSLFVDCVAAAREHGAATAAIPVVDSIKRGAAGVIVESLDRDGLYAIQTPQAFTRELLVKGHRQASAADVHADDDAALVEALGVTVHIVPGSPDNFKVTHPRDLVLLRALVADRS